MKAWCRSAGLSFLMPRKPGARALPNNPRMNHSSASIPIKQATLKVACSNCNLRELCLPLGFSEQVVQRMDTLVGARRALRRGYSPSDFHLRMTREEIGSYLGLKLETVSRLFSQFQKDGLIEVEQKHVRILDIAGLEKVLGSAH